MATPGVGSRIGPYEILARIGEGGMGIVFRARDTKLGRDVAIKTLPEGLADDPDRLMRFEREAQILASLNHPNIAQIYGFEESDGTRCIVMELIEGETLAERMRRAPLEVADALRIATQIADALEAAHERGVVHRDLKPSNIELLPDGKVKVLDFGLAKHVIGTPADPDMSRSPTMMTPVSSPGIILGTTAYMSPEQARGQSVDKRGDVWAFGVVLFEMLARQPAFAGATATDVLGAIVHKEPDWRNLPAGLPDELVRLLHRCLTKDSHHRLRDIADARLEIRDVLGAGGGSDSGSPAFPASRRAVTLTVLFAIIVVAGIAGLFRLRDFSVRSAAVTSGTLPLVIMMDSPNPARVYDSETLAANGTNADVISDVLSDLPIRRQKEAIGPEWHRDEEIRRFAPDLVIIHYSGFYPADYQGPRDRLRILIKFFEKTPTRFLIYSRNSEAQLKSNLDSLLAGLYGEDPGLRPRIRAFGVNDYGPPRWLDRITSSQLKLAVIDALNLQPSR